ncbi:acyl-ACP thioesterase [Schnuerera sp. xch1]|uniref:acyl-[acyl-carrier-protein] thioesterase n=1 Tax=Schnuerera sp. xch1 TaxID=2874283 RepID=UPI001CBAA018|nr:acyl-ACP thioesterase domain-containing protein [Schnuerera sp. xch1]MBZ2175458.1 acyl-ACP thioesterase [Schnuerera sp. xch1]
MEAVSLYSKDYEVDVNHIDFKGKLKLSSLFQFFQDIAGLHAENLGMGLNTLQEKYGVLWVLVRMRVDIVRYPLWKEKIIIDTWPQEPNKVEFMRDFMVKDSQGNILAKAVSTWVIIDIKTRRLEKTKAIYNGYPSIVNKRAIDCKLGKLKPKGKLGMVYKRTVRYSDIDVNEHLNNSRYVDFIMDCFSLHEHKRHSIKSIEVNYSNEASPGDTITLYKDMSEIDSNLIYIEGVNENNKLNFKSQVKIELI